MRQYFVTFIDLCLQLFEGWLGVVSSLALVEIEAREVIVFSSFSHVNDRSYWGHWEL